MALIPKSIYNTNTPTWQYSEGKYHLAYNLKSLGTDQRYVANPPRPHQQTDKALRPFYCKHKLIDDRPSQRLGTVCPPMFANSSLEPLWAQCGGSLTSRGRLGDCRCSRPAYLAGRFEPAWLGCAHDCSLCGIKDPKGHRWVSADHEPWMVAGPSSAGMTTWKSSSRHQ